MAALQLFIAPLAATIFTLWAAWLAFAAEAEAGPDRKSAPRSWRALPLPVPRSLHIAHLALLVLAGIASAGAAAWWAWSPMAGLLRLVLALGFVWVVADLLPRLLAEIAPELPRPMRRAAVPTLLPFRPLLRFIAWADAQARPTELSDSRRALGATQRDMLLGVFSLADTTVAEVMTPRIDIIAVDASADRDEVMATLRRSEHARLLVYDGHPDAVIGVIYAKDMLASPAGDDDNWASLVRPAAFVPEAKTLDRQLRDFQRGPSHLAVVVDEFGGTAGLVTLEDILEQVVGEIRDEYDTDEVAPIQPLGEDVWRVQGGVPLAELEALVGHEFGREDVSTVGGLVLAEFGRVPRSGEELDLGPVRLTVEQVVRRRVRRVVVRRVPVAAGEEREP
jgi:CBS domain containing-hemolysin-like protein